MNLSRLNKTTTGLTLIEILVVVAIVGILAAVIAVNAIESGKLSRDAKRQADLRSLQSAIELYKNKEGRYPYGCNAPEGSWSDVWSGQITSVDYRCTNGSTQYINGLAPKYIPTLPQDQRLNGNNSGYVYRTNAAGTVYKLMAMRTVEADSVDYNHEFKSCDIRPDVAGKLQNLGASGVDTSGWCATATEAALDPAGQVSTYNPIPGCRMNSGINVADNGNGRFEISYGVWGGFAEEMTGPHRAAEVRETARVICK